VFTELLGARLIGIGLDLKNKLMRRQKLANRLRCIFEIKKIRVLNVNIVFLK